MVSVKRTGSKATATRARILDAAAKEFRSNGYTGARLADIAEAAGMQSGSLYYHFASREDLVEEVVHVAQRRTTDFVRASVSAMPESATYAQKLAQAMTDHLVMVLEMSDYASATIRILGHLPENVLLRLRAEQREYARYWDELVLGAQTAGEIRTDLNSRGDAQADEGCAEFVA